MLQTDFEAVYDPAAFELVHVDTDNISASALHAHWDVHNPTFPVLVGSGSVYGNYGDGYIPYNVVIDTEGIIRYTDSGFAESQLHTIINQYMSVDFPVFTIDQLNIESDDNLDGRPDGGETVSFSVSLRNSPIAVPATDCSLVMTCSDPTVTVTQNTVSYGASTPGQVITSDGNFTFMVADGIEPHWATFTFTYTATYTGGTVSEELDHTQRMGRPAMLLVDSDGGMDDNEVFVTSALDAMTQGYDVWNGLSTPLAAEEMGRYSRILWLGGLNENDITDAEETGLRAFLDNGGQLLLSSQFLTDNPERADFLSQVFGVAVANTDAGSIFVVDGVVGDPYFDGTALVVTGTQGANNNEEPDLLTVTAPGQAFGVWRQAANAPAIVYTTGTNYHAVFAGFPVEATRVHSSVPGSMNSQTFLGHVLDYFNSTDVAPSPVVAVQDFRLVAATPNPFNPATSVEFSLAREGQVELALFNTLGQEVRRLGAGRLGAGLHEQRVDGAELASGLYLVRLVVDGENRDAMKVMLVK